MLFLVVLSTPNLAAKECEEEVGVDGQSDHLGVHQGDVDPIQADHGAVLTVDLVQITRTNITELFYILFFA